VRNAGQSRRLILSALDFIEAHNNVLKTVPRPPSVSLAMNVFTPVSSISYPEVTDIAFFKFKNTYPT
jgi:hypothetical protein